VIEFLKFVTPAESKKQGHRIQKRIPKTGIQLVYSVSLQLSENILFHGIVGNILHASGIEFRLNDERFFVFWHPWFSEEP
jgi:hypothetical protein